VLERTSEYFPPELLNRLDSILVFNKLSRESILQVVSLRLNDVSARLKNRRITLDIDGPAREWLARKGFSDVYGARAIARVVRSEVLFPLAQKLLQGTIRFDKSLCLWSSGVHDVLFRDGDSVSIRTSADDTTLNIQDNHPPDAFPVSRQAEAGSKTV
jgi:ATP-dependent Clp protease ATP-binding subunit ClpB